MPKYRNFARQTITIFLNNSIPIKFLAGEVKELKEEGLEKKYSFIGVLKGIKETKKEDEKSKEKSLISEVTQPENEKILIKEPVSEEVKKVPGKPGRPRREVIKEEKKDVSDEGYRPVPGEFTLGKVER